MASLTTCTRISNVPILATFSNV